MPRDKKQRIPIEASPELRTNPFAALDLGPLRAAPVEQSTAQTTPQKKPKERLLLRRSTAHRAGKTVLILEGFSPVWSAVQLEDLLHELKATLGCGGKIKDRHLELQGELTDRLLPLLEARNFTIKRGW